ncbi:MAG: hypothetical protein DDT22_01158 [candidate division WS2 bacterium]|nr:hypothetical protein [Bacillota bacterium]MBT9175479.1 hypothetical protein [Candidatus Lithacetigena glycinireducens]
MDVNNRANMKITVVKNDAFHYCKKRLAKLTQIAFLKLG